MSFPCPKIARFNAINFSLIKLSALWIIIKIWKSMFFTSSSENSLCLSPHGVWPLRKFRVTLKNTLSFPKNFAVSFPTRSLATANFYRSLKGTFSFSENSALSFPTRSLANAKISMSRLRKCFYFSKNFALSFPVRGLANAKFSTSRLRNTRYFPGSS